MAEGEHPITDRFEYQKDLGSGTFSVVWLGKDVKTSELSAIKEMDMNNAKFDLSMLKTEVDILSKVDHPNIIKLKEVCHTGNTYYMVLEYVTGGELFDHIVDRGFYAERSASLIMEGMFSALKHLHSLNIVHRDLKPENLLCENDSDDSPIKIADFGLSMMIRKDVVISTACGTPSYVAPEVLKQAKGGYSTEVDLWSAGVIMYILLCGFPPFYDDTTEGLFKKIMHGDYAFLSPWWDNVSADARDLVEKLLVVDPKQRLSIDDALAHPWVQGHGVPEEHLTDTIAEMAKWNAKRKLKGAVKAVMAAKRVASLGNLKKPDVVP